MGSQFKNKLIQDLKDAGYSILRHGRHDVYAHPNHPTHITVPRELNDHTLYKRIRKIALTAAGTRTPVSTAGAVNLG